MFVNSMATRRTKRTRRTRKGSGWLSQTARSWGMYDGSSTSALAREIYAMLNETGIKPSRYADFENLMMHHPHVKRGKLLRDLQRLGMTPKQEYEVVANLNIVIPSRIEKYDTTTM